MYFCPKCNYSFDISKTVDTDVNTDKIILKKVSDSIKLFETNTSFENYKAEFKTEDLEKNSKFKKLSDIDKKKFEELFNMPVSSGAQFKCNNCNYSKDIVESVLLYQYTIDNKTTTVKSLEDNELLCNNPTLPRTHDYICKNVLCPTLKKNMKKEAVFFRERDSYKINYICTICFYNW
jgi:hypothetical protein